MAVGDHLLRQIRVHRGGADADQDREVMHVQALGRAHVERGEGAQLLPDQMGVHGAGGEDHRHHRPVGGDRVVGQDQMRAALAHRVLGLALNPADGVAQRVGASGGVEGTVDVGRGVAHIGAHRLELGGRQHRRVELQHAALVLVLGQNISEVAEAGPERHHPGFA
jgi:hypothetical protein